jgi:hypothetical protein
VQAETQTPPTQYGSAELQSVLLLHAVLGLGTHAPFVHVDPVGHATTGALLLHVPRH